jgi:hypothetical protein
LHGLDLTLDRPDWSRQRRRIDPGRLARVLRTVFGIVVSDDEARRLAVVHSDPSTGGAMRPETAA